MSLKLVVYFRKVITLQYSVLTHCHHLGLFTCASVRLNLPLSHFFHWTVFLARLEFGLVLVGPNLTRTSEISPFTQFGHTIKFWELHLFFFFFCQHEMAITTGIEHQSRINNINLLSSSRKFIDQPSVLTQGPDNMPSTDGPPTFLKIPIYIFIVIAHSAMCKMRVDPSVCLQSLKLIKHTWRDVILIPKGKTKSQLTKVGSEKTN